MKQLLLALKFPKLYFFNDFTAQKNGFSEIGKYYIINSNYIKSLK
ncbi:hypothetical protein LEP1GSC193_2389 [Leptospira alstonii serovar Pingchang str. 80-412]|uniref:Uncharacterized protein n=2 Tax=Leptospira alstonii TaxID=28452 RepID=M6D2J5_9LEPT|nr:hypothetical protein LEP1GSC194_2428 [Leptospira alstonii serovar Sichuan str. 79601]EQA80861.1 hypothetical protein LEP1GSC193_2389 [Leptospira alstonii serovar Pingchang str. 80-412]